MTRGGQARSGLGAASLILILLVLCLALLGVLSMMSARADLRLAQRHAQLAGQYAQAVSLAQRALHALDAQMTKAWQESASEETYAAACRQIAGADGTDVVWLDERTAQMRFDAGAERELLVEIVRSTWDEAGITRWDLTKHQLLDTKEWEQTEGLLLMGM